VPANSLGKSDPWQEIATQLVNALTCLAAELALESGPYDAGLIALVKTARASVEPIRDSYHATQEINPAGSAGDPVRLLKQRIGDCFDNVLAPLDKASLEPAQTDTQKKVAQKKAEEISKACVRLRDSVCKDFHIDLPKRMPYTATEAERAIVVTDLIRYTQKVELLKPTRFVLGNKGMLNVVEVLNQTIKDQIMNALAILGAGYGVDQNVFVSTGDGAILRFTNVEEAVRFARALHDETEKYNQTARLADPYRHRIGIAFGWVKFRLNVFGGERKVESVGIPFIEAARMESCCPASGIAIEQKAWQRLVNELNVPSGTDLSSHELLGGFTEDRDLRAKNAEVYQGWVLQPRS